jgi:hypothetical protein
MSWIARTLWDLVNPAPKPRPEPKPQSRTRPTAGARSKMQDRYAALVADMKRTYRVRVRKWRSSSTGCAWEVHYANGATVRLIEAPYPKGPMSCAIFLHEIGHHAIGFGTYKPRCLEEYHAWRWSLQTMRERGFNVTERVEQRMAESLRYAVDKARRRGLRRLPEELAPYAGEPSAISRQPSAERARPKS